MSISLQNTEELIAEIAGLRGDKERLTNTVAHLQRRVDMLEKLVFGSKSERLAWRSGYYKIRYKREKYADPDNPLAGVVTAPHPGDLFDGKTGKEKFDASFIAHTVVAKTCDSLPLYRQSKALEREGIEVGRSTLSLLMSNTASLLVAIYLAMKEELLLRGVIHTDDSPVRPLLDPGRGKCKTARIWVALSGTGPPLAVFEFTPDRKSEHPNKFFEKYSGTLIADDYAGYDGVFKKVDGAVLHAACWAHARRKFHESLDSAREDAQRILSLIRALYAIEREAKEKAAGKTEFDLFSIRRKLRAKESTKLVAQILAESARIVAAHPPKAPIAVAANYALNLREELSRFLANPKLNIDNNPAENALRPVALGKKNWMFAGSEEGGQNLAILLSLVETCKRDGINPHTYIEDVLGRISKTPSSRIVELIPHNWKLLREAEKAAEAVNGDEPPQSA